MHLFRNATNAETANTQILELAARWDRHAFIHRVLSVFSFLVLFFHLSVGLSSSLSISLSISLSLIEDGRGDVFVFLMLILLDLLTEGKA